MELDLEFMNPEIILDHPHGIDLILRGLVEEHVQLFDHAVTSAVTDHLFEEADNPISGMDLIALNLMRGRDHGLPPYNDYRHFCKLKRAQTFHDLESEIPSKIVAQLALAYKHVDDIDLFTGGISERSVYGGLVSLFFTVRNM